MPTIPHIERHFRATETVRDIVIGMSDGLTVPFALAAGLSGAVASTSIVVTAGLAEIAAGSIAMGLGGYLAAKTDIEHYDTERKREISETKDVPDKEKGEIVDVFRGYGLTEDQIAPIVDSISSEREKWVDFMMRFELGLDKPDQARARNSAFTIAASYIMGGLIPLSPYIISHQIKVSLLFSIALTLAALFIFGYIKARFTGINSIRGALQTILVGGLAAGAAYFIARMISS
ncbi:MAG: VIT1/CCC1 transporter family protein [Thermodesulfobacteriota bacterium]